MAFFIQVVEGVVESLLEADLSALLVHWMLLLAPGTPPSVVEPHNLHHARSQPSMYVVQGYFAHKKPPPL